MINDANSVYTYDLGNRLTGLVTHLNDQEDPNITYAFTHDKMGNRLSITKDGEITLYEYDDIYQLTGDPNDDNTTYNYDALGSRTSVVSNSGTVNYNSNSVNQYTSVGGTGFSYDDNGNLTSENTSLGKTYSYDCENQLVSVVLADSTEITYKYDAFGRRVERVVDDGETETTAKFIYDGFHVIAEYGDGGTLLRKYVYGPGIDEPLAMIDVDGQTETWYYYHFNGLGSVIAISDENGDLVESYSYTVFGEPTIYDGDGDEIATSAVNNPYMFTGRRYDEDTGLYYYRLRDYHSVLGRFVQTDPIGYAGGMNLYAYVSNNPTNWTDPFGLISISIAADGSINTNGQPNVIRQNNRPHVTPEDFLINPFAMVPIPNLWPPNDYINEPGGMPTKGKELTQTMLFQAMLECYEENILGKEEDGLYDTDFWMNVDSVFHRGENTNRRFIYEGHVYTGEEVNYIGIGMAIRHLGYNKYHIVGLPHAHNLFNTERPHFATSGEIYFTKLGFLYYPLIRDWHQRRQRNNIR